MKPYKDRNGREINNAFDYDDFTRWLFNQQPQSSYSFHQTPTSLLIQTPAH